MNTNNIKTPEKKKSKSKNWRLLQNKKKLQKINHETFKIYFQFSRDFVISIRKNPIRGSISIFNWYHRNPFLPLLTPRVIAETFKIIWYSKLKNFTFIIQRSEWARDRATSTRALRAVIGCNQEHGPVRKNRGCYWGSARWLRCYFLGANPLPYHPLYCA